MAEIAKLSPRVRGKTPVNSGIECLVVGCNNRTGKDKLQGEKRSYHTLPTVPSLRRKWLAAIPRAKRVPKAWHRICSDHFAGGKRTRKPGTPGFIPSVFRSLNTNNKTRTTHTAQRASFQSEISDTNKPKRKACVKIRRHVPVKNAVWNTTDHDYVATKTDNKVPTKLQLAEHTIHELRSQIEDLKVRALCLDSLKDTNDFQFYTNFPNFAVFDSVAEYLFERGGSRLKYWRGSETTKYDHFDKDMTQKGKPGPERKLSFKEEFFLTVVRLKTGSSNKDLAVRFGVDETLVSRVLSTWVNFLDQELKLLFEMVDDDENVAECYRDMPDLKIVIDCTEQQCEKSSNLQARKETFSNYKQRDTLKWLVGLSRNLTVNYVSCSYGGRASDKHITLNSDSLLDNLQAGSKVMGDRGFTVADDLKKLGVKLILPDFKGCNRSQMSREECERSEFISAARIHIERIIQRLRTYHVLDSPAKLSMKDIYDQMFTTCAYLCNFQLPIIQRRINEE